MRRLPTATGIGVLAGALCFVGAGTPSYWGDEAASVLAASRPLPTLFAMLGNVDAVHGVYYVFLHYWTALVGTSEAAVRLPSAVAVGIAAAGTVALARCLFGTPTGLIAGVIFAVVPQATRMGVEARSYAFSMAAAVWLTYFFVALVRRRITRWWPWLLYAAAAAASVYVFLYLVFVLAAHAAGLVLLRADGRTTRRWGASAGLAVVLATPVLAAGIGQRDQIAFLARRDYATASSVFVHQWFGTLAFAVTAWALIALGLFGVAARWVTDWRAVTFVTVWAFVPSAVLIIGNDVVAPMYNLRYVTFCVPALAILMALGLRAAADGFRRPVARSAVVVAGIAVIACAAAPSYVAQRGPFAKDGGSDLRQTAQTIAAHAAAGDAVIFDESVKPSRKPRLARDLYPASFSGLDDIGLIDSYRERPHLWDKVAPLATLTDRVDAHAVVWAVEASPTAPDVAALESLGYSVVTTIDVHRTVIYKLVKE